MPASGAQKAEVAVAEADEKPAHWSDGLLRIPLKSIVTTEGIEGMGGRTRTLSKGSPGLQGMVLDYFPGINAVRVQLPPIPGRADRSVREHLVPWPNVSDAVPW